VEKRIESTFKARMKKSAQRSTERYTANNIVRVPLTVNQTAGGGVDNPLCPGLTGPAVFDFGDLEYFNDGVAQVSPCQFTYDPRDYPGLTEIRIIGGLAKEDVAYETAPTISLVDDDGTVYWTLDAGAVYIPNADDTYFLLARFDDVVTLHTSLEKKTYYLKWSKVSAAGGGFEAMNPQVWIFFEESDQAKFQLPMLRGLFLDGNGLYDDSNPGSTLDTYAQMDGQISGAVVPVETGAFSEVDYREIYIVAHKSTGAGTVALKDITAGTIIAATEIAIAAGNGTDYVVYTLQLPESTFTVGNEIAFWGKHSVLNQRVILVSADLNVKVGSPTTGYFTAPDLCAEAAEVYVRAGVVDCEVVYRDRAYLHKSAYWPGSALFYYEGTERNSFFLTLIDTGTIAVPALTAVTTLSFGAGLTYHQERSAAISLTDLHLYASGRDGSGSSTTPDVDVTAFIVGAISGP
jgi:hypothetical protein